jgi:hypothetical protein
MKTGHQNIEISFNKEDSDERISQGWNWFYGTMKLVDKEFDFSLCEMNTKVGGQNTTATEITWVNETPNGHENIERMIVRKFENEFIS